MEHLPNKPELVYSFVCGFLQECGLITIFGSVFLEPSPSPTQTHTHTQIQPAGLPGYDSSEAYNIPNLA